ncbi:hypothetical protein [uncultured Clostridium sp.]|mgnify:CR=1 FL=1|uniref:hypothetical protein n=1 Tax=uncultured Clostridium sp. TaxID=59620 RepID=UPI0025CF4F1E|nr:hypothetical protein [uncultured Clostridium sp.]
MLKFFRDNKLKQDLINSINKLLSVDSRHITINIENDFLDFTDGEEIIKYLEGIKCIGEKYTENELEDLWFEEDGEEIILTGKEEITIYLDESESEIEITIDEFIQLVDEAEGCSINEDGICISKTRAILRVSTNDIFEESYDSLLELYSELYYKGKYVQISLNTSSELYALRIFLNYEFDELNPVINCDDLFVEISFDDSSSSIELDSVNEIFNVYIFKVFSEYGVKLELNPRYSYVDEIEEPKIDGDLELDSKLFSKGMKDIIFMFNKAEGYNNDRAIVEYVKVIEYVSATVIREEVTVAVQQKLQGFQVCNIDADYIKELGDIFLNSKQKYTTDSEMIKITIKKCCNIESLSKYAPTFMSQLKNLSKKISQQPNNKQVLCNQAYGELAKSISDTRNNLSHAKANYDRKGLECPDIQKDEFVILLRNVTLQVIEWFYNSDESIRIINE